MQLMLIYLKFLNPKVLIIFHHQQNGKTKDVTNLKNEDHNDNHIKLNNFANDGLVV